MAQTLRLDDFAGGLNEIVGTKLKPNESPFCQNVIFNEQGAIVKRKGYQSILDSEIDSNPITGLYIYHEKDGTRHMLATSGTNIYEIDEQNGTYSSIKSGLTSGESFSFTTLGNKCYMSNGVDDIQIYDGTNSTVTAESGYKHGDYIVDHYNHLFIAGNSSEPSKLYYYELANPDNEYQFDINTDDGDYITGIAPIQGNLAIFKSNSIHVLYGTDPGNFQLKEVQPNIGCIAPQSIINIWNKLYFFYRDGIYSFDGNSVYMLSRKVDPTIKKISDPLKCSSAWYNHHYMLSYPDGSSQSSTKVLVYDILNEAWSRFTNIPASIWNNFDGAQDGQANIGELYFGDSSTGQIYEWDNGNTDDGNPIDMRYQTKNFDLDQQEIVKTFRKILVDSVSTGEVELSYSIDKGRKTGSMNVIGYDDSPDSLFGESTWGGTTWTEPTITTFGKSLRAKDYGANISYTFRDYSDKETKIFGLTQLIRPRRQRFGR